MDCGVGFVDIGQLPSCGAQLAVCMGEGGMDGGGREKMCMVELFPKECDTQDKEGGGRGSTALQDAWRGGKTGNAQGEWTPRVASGIPDKTAIMTQMTMRITVSRAIGAGSRFGFPEKTANPAPASLPESWKLPN